MISGTTHIKALHYTERDPTLQRNLVAIRMTEEEGATACGEGCCQSSSEEGSLKREEKVASSSIWDPKDIARESGTGDKGKLQPEEGAHAGGCGRACSQDGSCLLVPSTLCP